MSKHDLLLINISMLLCKLNKIIILSVITLVVRYKKISIEIILLNSESCNSKNCFVVYCTYKRFNVEYRFLFRRYFIFSRNY